MRWLLIALALAFGPAAHAQNTAGSLMGGGGGGSGVVAAPTFAAANGYNTRTLNIPSFSTSMIDFGLTYASGFKFYFNNCHNFTPNPSSVTVNGDGSITVGQGSDLTNENLQSVGCQSGSPYYVGTAYGGGYYIQETVALTQTCTAQSDGWPAWWFEALERLTIVQNPNGPQWPGQATGYQHYGEIDWECSSVDSPPQSGTANDWWGATGLSVVRDHSVRAAAAIGAQHVYGMLVVPATPTSNGKIQWDIDGTVFKTTTYTQYVGSATSPPPCINVSAQETCASGPQPWMFGINDVSHMALEFGSSAAEPIKVYSIAIWQASNAGNVTN